MSLARAFTTRRNRPEKPTIQRSQISAPVALVSSTNSLVYDAPDISSIVSPGSVSSVSPSSSIGSPASQTSSRSVSLTSASSVEENHLTCYFSRAERVAEQHPSPPVPARSGRSEQAQAHQTQTQTQTHPFSRELAQLDEVVEEYADLSPGLCRFGASDYISEIADLMPAAFEDEAWI